MTTDWRPRDLGHQSGVSSKAGLGPALNATWVKYLLTDH